MCINIQPRPLLESRVSPITGRRCVKRSEWPGHAAGLVDARLAELAARRPLPFGGSVLVDSRTQDDGREPACELTDAQRDEISLLESMPPDDELYILLCPCGEQVYAEGAICGTCEAEGRAEAA